MKTVEIILNLVEQNNLTKNKFLTDIGLGKNTFVNWINRGTSPSGDDLAKIADYFNVSADYLLGRETPDGFDLSPHEEELIRRYRIASSDDRAMVDLALRKYAANPAGITESAV